MTLICPSGFHWNEPHSIPLFTNKFCFDAMNRGLLIIHIKGSWLRPNKKISLFRVTGLKILGRVGTHICLIFFFWKKYNFMYFERHFAFQNA